MSWLVFFRRLLLCAAFYTLALPDAARAALVSFDAAFSTEDQSMWGEGGAFELNFNQRLFDPITWGSREAPLSFSGSAIKDVGIPSHTFQNPLWTAWNVRRVLHDRSCVTIFGTRRCAVRPPGAEPPKTLTTPAVDGKFGLEAEGSTAGSFALDFSARIAGGSVAADLPLQVEFSIDETELAPGSPFTISSNFFVAPQAALNTISPEAEAALDLDLDLFVESTSSGCFGNAGCDEFEFIPDIDVNGSFEVLGIDDEGLRFFGVPKDDLAETIIGEVADHALEKRDDGEKDELQKTIDLEAQKEKSATEEIRRLDQNITSQKKSIADLDRDLAAKDKELADIDKKIADTEKAAKRTDEQIASNNARVDEINTTLADPNSGLSQAEKDRLATERSGLVAQNDRFAKRRTALEGQQKDLEETTRPVAAAERDNLDSERTAKKSDLDTLNDDKKRKKTEQADARKNKKDARFKKNANSLLSKIPKIGDLIDVDLSLPVVETDGSLDLESGTTRLVSEGEDQFLEMLLGIDDALVLATKAGITAASAGAGSFVFLIPPLSSELELTDILRAEYAIFDLNVGPRLFATQGFEFTPEFEVELSTGFGDPITFDLGDEVEILFPEDATELTLEPTIRLKETDNFTNKTGIRVQPVAELAVLGAIAGVDPPQAVKNAGIDTQQISLGPLVGSIDGIDLVPLEHEFERLDFGFDIFTKSFTLGGFSPIEGSRITVKSDPVVLLSGGAFDSLADWDSFGNVSLVARPDEPADQAARLEAASAVSVSTVLDTPLAPFFLVFEYRFDTPGGVLTIFLDSLLIETIDAIVTDDFLTRRTFIDDVALLGLAGASLVFEFFGTTGTAMLLDNIGVTNLAQLNVAAVLVPEPAGWMVFVLGLAALCLLWWRGRSRA